jgi:broad specificity phosphatase PhoE
MLIVVRHGRTVLNAEGQLQGRIDAELDAVGEQQAAAIAAALGPVDRVVASPLRRTQQTAAALGAPVTSDERWIELDYGELDGVPLRDVPPELWLRWRSDLTWAPAGGESLVDLAARVKTACDDLVDEASERDVVVVTHVSPIKAAVAWALGVDDDAVWRMFVTPASITRIGTSERGAVLRSFNETAHLP